MSQPRLVAVVVAVAAAAAGCNKTDKLTVTGIDPQQGDYLGGTPVDIKGTGFQDEKIMRNAKVYFGHKDKNDFRQGVVVKFDGDSDLWVQAPGGVKGDVVDVKIIFEPGGEKTIDKAFTYVEVKQADVDDLSTGSGSASGSSK